MQIGTAEIARSSVGAQLFWVTCSLIDEFQ
jgi:hypothetical protein